MQSDNITMPPIIHPSPAPIPPTEEVKDYPISIGNHFLNMSIQLMNEMDQLSNEILGTLGLSPNQLFHPHIPQFINQLSSNNIISNSVFYFEFPQTHRHSKRGFQDLDEYLSYKGVLTIGDYPYNIIPNRCQNKNRRTAKIQKILRNPLPLLNDPTLNEAEDVVIYDPTKCIGCGACVRNCGMAKGIDWTKLTCIQCGQCSVVCPKEAIFEKNSIDEVESVLKNKKGKVVTVQIAPASRINMAELLGVEPGVISTGKLVTVLKMLGFDYVFDTAFSADMTTAEEATEFISRLNDPHAVFPMFTSCCPAWINYVEKKDPSLIPNLSSCKSPLSMLSSVIKNIFSQKINVNRDDIYNIAIMPCTAKKDEIQRPQLNKDTDAVLTVRELAKMIKSRRIDFASLNDTEMDTIYSEHTGGGSIFCATGGVMESALRSAYKFLTGKDMDPIELKDLRGTKDTIKTASVDIQGRKINVAVAHGIYNAKVLIEKIRNKEPGFENIHFVEVMACPGGCLNGGGSPRTQGLEGSDKRNQAAYKIDEASKKRTSQDNEQLQKLYNESFGGEFGSPEAKKLLHTHYNNRKIDKVWGMSFKNIAFNHSSLSAFYYNAYMMVESNYLVAPNDFLYLFNREFFFLPGINEKCQINSNEKFTYFVCDDDLDIDRFPSLEFYSDELNRTFVLNGKDLFVHDGDSGKLLFLVMFDLNMENENTWFLGLPFLRNDIFYFDLDNENIGVCERSENVTLVSMVNKGLFGLVILLTFAVVYFASKNNGGKKNKKVIGRELIDVDYVES